MQKQALLYVHIPFCIRRCKYCSSCVVMGDSSTKQAYMKALERELESALPMLKEYQYPAIYFGGGSPSVMRPDDLASFLRTIKKNLTLDLGAEITIEVMPQTVGTPSLSGIKSSGYNRISLSLQSVVNEELETLDCGFRNQDTEEALILLRRFTFKNINTDIMVGIPGQDTLSLKRTLRFVAAYDPTHVSLYSFPGISDFAGERECSPSSGSPPVETLKTQAKDFLVDLGYHQYSQGHFSKSGYESKYFRLRYEGMDYFGLGLGARSLVDGVMWENTTDLALYLESSSNFESITAQATTLTQEQQDEYLVESRKLLLQ